MEQYLSKASSSKPETPSIPWYYNLGSCVEPKMFEEKASPNMDKPQTVDRTPHQTELQRYYSASSSIEQKTSEVKATANMDKPETVDRTAHRAEQKTPEVKASPNIDKPQILDRTPQHDDKGRLLSSTVVCWVNAQALISIC